MASVATRFGFCVLRVKVRSGMSAVEMIGKSSSGSGGSGLFW